jgi:serine/threonine protein kinase
MTGQTGSPRYMAPEVSLSQPYNESVDVYSLSIIIHEIITGFPSFRGIPLVKFQEMIVKENQRPGLDYDEYGRALNLHPRMRALLASSWSSAMNERPPIEEVLTTLSEIEAEYKKRDEDKPQILKLWKNTFREKDPI